MDPTSALESLQREIDTILILFNRPVVRLLLIVLLGGIASSWIITLVARRFIRRWINEDEPKNLRQTALTFIDTLAFPLLALVVVQVEIAVLGLQGLPSGILWDVQPILLIFLGYEFILALLYSRYPADIVKLFHNWVLWPSFLVLIFYLVVNNFLNFALIRRIPLFTVFEVEITVGMIVQIIFIVYVFGTAAYLLQKALERAMARRTTQITSTTSIIIVIRYAVIALGIIILGISLGVNAATLAVIGGGLSIGIGFGLQQIFANFISGLLLLFEQSLRPGDVIELNQKLGIVKQVNIRSTTIVTNDNVEIIVPNEHFLINDVTTYTRTSTRVRVPIIYGISYGSDPKFARDLVVKTVSKHGNVLSNPEPEVQFLGFGESSLDFRLLVWMDNPIRTPRFRSDIYFMIWDAFAKHDIEIPFPQRDLHLRSGWEVFDRQEPPAE